MLEIGTRGVPYYSASLLAYVNYPKAAVNMEGYRHRSSCEQNAKTTEKR
jgi:hypothetical protein